MICTLNVHLFFVDCSSIIIIFRLLTRFEGALERDGMHSQQSLLNIACSVKARPREITMSRANKVSYFNLLVSCCIDSDLSKE